MATAATREKNIVTGGVRRAAASTTGKTRTDFWSYRTARTPSEAQVFRAHASLRGACENLMCAVKILANQQTAGGILVDTFLDGLQEQVEDHV